MVQTKTVTPQTILDLVGLLSADERRWLVKQLNQPESASQQVYTKLPPNRWVEQFGRFKDDPTFDDLQQEIATYRQTIDDEASSS